MPQRCGATSKIPADTKDPRLEKPLGHKPMNTSDNFLSANNVGPSDMYHISIPGACRATLIKVSFTQQGTCEELISGSDASTAMSE